MPTYASRIWHAHSNRKLGTKFQYKITEYDGNDLPRAQMNINHSNYSTVLTRKTFHCISEHHIQYFVVASWLTFQTADYSSTACRMKITIIQYYTL